MKRDDDEHCGGRGECGHAPVLPPLRSGCAFDPRGIESGHQRRFASWIDRRHGGTPGKIAQRLCQRLVEPFAVIAHVHSPVSIAAPPTV